MNADEDSVPSPAVTASFNDFRTFLSLYVPGQESRVGGDGRPGCINSNYFMPSWMLQGEEKGEGGDSKEEDETSNEDEESEDSS